MRRAEVPWAPPRPRRRNVPRELRVDYRPFPWPTRLMPRYERGQATRQGPWSDFGVPLPPAGARTDLEWAELLGCHPRQLYRWFAKGLTYWQADAVAAALGLHPALIWSNWWDVTAAIVELEEAAA